MFGARPKDGWWDRPAPSEQNSTQNPSWLWSFLSPQAVPKLAYSPPRPQYFEISAEVVETDGFRSAEERLLEGLAVIKTQEALMALLADLSIDLTRKPHLAQKMLRHILAHKWDREQLAEFLLEPRTNPSGSGNHTYLFQNFQEHQSVVLWLIQRKVCFKAAQLGLLDVGDLRTILLLAPSLRLDMRVDHSGGAATSQYDFAWASFSKDLLSAAKASKVISLNDLGQSFATQWCQVIENQEFQPDMPQLLLQLYEFMGHPGRIGLQQTLRRSIQAINIGSLCHLPMLVDFALSKPGSNFSKVLLPVTEGFVADVKTTPSFLEDHVHDEETEHFRQALATTVLRYRENCRSALYRPVDKIESSVRRLQNIGDNAEDYRIARSSPELHRPPSDLEKWYAFLSILNTPSFSSFKLHQGFFGMRLRNKQSNLQEKQTFIIKLWISTALSEHDYKAVENLGKVSVPKFLQLLSPSSGDNTQDMLVGLLVALRGLPLPAKHHVLRRTSYFSRGLLVVKRNYADLLKCMDDLQDGQILSLHDDRHYRMAQFHFPALLTKVVESMNADMTRFEATCRTLIRETKEGPGIVYRLLKHNRSMQFALGRLATLSFSYPFRWNNEGAAQEQAVGNYSYNQVIDMINNFAMECAKSPLLSPRKALRDVFFFYQLLHRYRAPIKPAILEALWVAGVMRYSGASSMTVVSWLHERIVQYMGKEIAKAYLDRTILYDRDTKRMAAIRDRIVEQEWKLQRTECSLRSLYELQPTGILSAELESMDFGAMGSSLAQEDGASISAHADSFEVSSQNSSFNVTARQGQSNQYLLFRPMQMVSEGETVTDTAPEYFIKHLDLPSKVTDGTNIKVVSSETPNCKAKPVDHCDEQLQASQASESLQHGTMVVKAGRPYPLSTSGKSHETEKHNQTTKSEVQPKSMPQQLVNSTYCAPQQFDTSKSKQMTTVSLMPGPDASVITLSPKQEPTEVRLLPDISKINTPMCTPEQPQQKNNGAPHCVLPGLDALESKTLTHAGQELRSKDFTVTPDSKLESTKPETGEKPPHLQSCSTASLVTLPSHPILRLLPQAERKVTSKLFATSDPKPAVPFSLAAGLPLSQALIDHQTFTPAPPSSAEEYVPLPIQPVIPISNNDFFSIKASQSPGRMIRKKRATLVRYHEVMCVRKLEHDLPGSNLDVPIAEEDKYAGYRERIKARIVHEARLRQRLGGVEVGGGKEGKGGPKG